MQCCTEMYTNVRTRKTEREKEHFSWLCVSSKYLRNKFKYMKNSYENYHTLRLTIQSHRLHKIWNSLWKCRWVVAWLLLLLFLSCSFRSHSAHYLILKLSVQFISHTKSTHSHIQSRSSFRVPFDWWSFRCRMCANTCVHAFVWYTMWTQNHDQALVISPLKPSVKICRNQTNVDLLQLDLKSITWSSLVSAFGIRYFFQFQLSKWIG